MRRTGTRRGAGRRGLALVVALTAAVGPALAQEEILSFRSTISLAEDGELHVVERLSVRAEGDEVRRGIYRDFPVLYRTRWGFLREVPFEVQSVRRDGNPEPFHLDRQAAPGFVRVYIGREDVTLAPGLYTYELEYRTARQVIHGSEEDELYWNVTGDKWAFPIREAVAEVRLPRDVAEQVGAVQGFTGRRGGRGRDWGHRRQPDGAIEFRTTRVLAPGEGFTIRVAWPTGLVTPPSRETVLRDMWQANRSAAIAFLGLLLVTGYYVITWSRYGRDPEGRAIMPEFEPPSGYSPAAVRFIRRMGYDRKAFATAVVDLAVKGALRIEEDSGSFTLTPTGNAPAGLPAAEAVLLKHLFPAGSALQLTSANHEIVGKALKAFRTRLRAEYEQHYFETNRGWFLLGVGLSALIVLAANLAGRVLAISLFMSLWLSIWSVGVTYLLIMVFQGWRAVIRASGIARVGLVFPALFITAFSVPFVAGQGFGMWMLSQSVGLPTLGLYVVLGAVNAVFYHLLKAPTLAGRALLDRVEGLRLYLGKAEQGRLEFMTPARETPEQFERLLPYAMALDVETTWARRFEETFPHQAAQGAGGGLGGQAWYASSGGTPGYAALAGAVGGALAGSLATASTAPSSGGGGGGGFSGGGGGGGGGGGW